MFQGLGRLLSEVQVSMFLGYIIFRQRILKLPLLL